MQGDLAEVVAAAAKHARPGDIVLLSPACSSFDMFENYEERGHSFSERAVPWKNSRLRPSSLAVARIRARTP